MAMGNKKTAESSAVENTVRCRAKISVATQTKLFTNTAFCVCTWISRSFRILPVPSCGLGRIGKHHILWLISPCHSQCSMVSEACQGFWPRPVPVHDGCCSFATSIRKIHHVAGGFLRNHLSNNKQTGIRHSDARLPMWYPNAMHRNGAYNCALLRGRKAALVCSTNWNLSIT